MSQYATIADAQNFLPQWRIDATSRPNETEVSGFLTRLSARLDAIVATHGYLTPVTGAQSLDVLKSICLAGAGWYVGRTLFPQGGVPAVDEYAKEYQDMMQALADNMLGLSDAPTNSGDAPETALDRVIDPTGAFASAALPFFTRGMVF